MLAPYPVRIKPRQHLGSGSSTPAHVNTNSWSFFAGPSVFESKRYRLGG
jgi:hypothetical protein